MSSWDGVWHKKSANATACCNAGREQQNPGVLHDLGDHPGSPASPGESQQNLQLPGCHLTAPISTEDSRKAMELRLKCPLFLPETQSCGTIHSTAGENKYVGKAYYARALRLCSTSPKFLGKSLHQFGPLQY